MIRHLEQPIIDLSNELEFPIGQLDIVQCSELGLSHLAVTQPERVAYLVQISNNKRMLYMPPTLGES